MPVPVFSVLGHHEEIGRFRDTQIATILGQECVLYIEGPAVGDVACLRTRGMIASKPRKVSIKALKGGWTESSAYDAVPPGSG